MPTAVVTVRYTETSLSISSVQRLQAAAAAAALDFHFTRFVISNFDLTGAYVGAR